MEFELLDENKYLKFYQSLHDARLYNQHGCFVSLDYPENYKSHQNFLLDNGVAGFSINGNDLVGVHKNPILAEQKGYNHVAEELILVALAHGAQTLDCYGDFLANMYMQYGFIPTGKMKFNKEYNLDWNTNKYGEPDVIAMCCAVSNIDELLKLRANNQLLRYTDMKYKINEFNDYMELLNHRDKVLKHIQSNNLTYLEACQDIAKEHNA